MRAEVVSCESQPDNQTHVTKNALFIAKNGICELRVKAGQCLGLFQVRLDYRDMDGVIGVAGPYSRHSNQLGSSLWRSRERRRKEGEKTYNRLRLASFRIIAQAVIIVS